MSCKIEQAIGTLKKLLESKNMSDKAYAREAIGVMLDNVLELKAVKRDLDVMYGAGKGTSYIKPVRYLPQYKDGQSTMTYAGIGSRETPPEILEAMTKVAGLLRDKGYILQTGKTFDDQEEGADKAFSIGTDKNKKILFGPEEYGEDEIALRVVADIHPFPDKLKPGAKKLMARNTFQVFGKKLDTPVDFVLFYAKETENPLRPEGGTGQAVELARRNGIPTINMAEADWKDKLEAITSAKTSNNNNNVDKEVDYSEVKAYVIGSGKAGYKHLRDKFRISYNKIKEFQEQLMGDNIISEADGKITVNSNQIVNNNVDNNSIENEDIINNSNEIDRTNRIDWKEFIKTYFIDMKKYLANENKNKRDPGSIDTTETYNSNATEIHTDMKTKPLIRKSTKAESNNDEGLEFATEVLNDFINKVKELSDRKNMYTLEAINKALDDINTGFNIQKLRGILQKAAEETMNNIEDHHPYGQDAFSKALEQGKTSTNESTLSATEKNLLDRILSSDPRVAGWKIHLKLKDATENSVGNKAAKSFLEKAREDGEIKHYKIGRNGDQTGKDVTIYVGSKDNTDAVAKSLLEILGEHLDDNVGTDAALDDIAINGNKILARFDKDAIDDDMHQYGANGVSIMKEDIIEYYGVFGNTMATPSEQQKMLDKADNRNKRIYGEYYTGTKTNSIKATAKTTNDIMNDITNGCEG